MRSTVNERRATIGSPVRKRRFRLVALIAAASVACSVGFAAGVGTARAGGQADVPSVPRDVRAFGADSAVVVRFSPPEHIGDGPISSYFVIVTDSTGGTTQANGPKSPITVTGLNNGDLYYVQVSAVNQAGGGPFAPGIDPAVPTTYDGPAPSPPLNVSATRGDGSATVSYTAPAPGNGDFVPEGFIATAINLTDPADGGQNAFGGFPDGQPVPITVTGLTNGDQYVFNVVAQDQTGPSFPGPATSLLSEPSAFSNPVTPAGPPGPPKIGKVTAGDGSATVAFEAPDDDGGAPVTEYEVVAEDETDPLRSGERAIGPASPLTVPELVNGHTYTFRMVARNEAGRSRRSPPSEPVTLPVGPGNPPGPPTDVSARAGDGEASVSFKPPEETGSDPITSYTVFAINHPAGGTPTQVEAFGDESPITIRLANDDLWTVSVAANNDAGQGPAAPAINVVWPSSAARFAPDPPTNVTAVPGNNQATVTYDAPTGRTDDFVLYAYLATAIDLTDPTQGGQYGLVSAPDGQPVPIPIGGLTNGHVYVFSVIAQNSPAPSWTGPQTYPTSAPSDPSAPVVPVGPPDAPTIGEATAGNDRASVTFTPPSFDNGAPIIDYYVRAEDETEPSRGGQSATGPDSPIVVDGLIDGHTYTFRVQARNEAGLGTPSAPSNAVVPEGAPPTDPGAPTDVRASAGNGEATVEFSPPKKNGGSHIVGYTVTAIDRTEPGRGGQSAASTDTSATVRNLTNGDRYVFRVTATNAVGTGPPSDPSDPIVPEGPNGREAPEREPNRDEPRDEEPEPNREEEPRREEEEPETTTASRDGSRLTRLSPRPF